VSMTLRSHFNWLIDNIYHHITHAYLFSFMVSQYNGNQYFSTSTDNKTGNI